MASAASSQFEKAKDNYQRYSYARDNGHMDFVEKAKRCESFYRGLQWEEKIRKRLEMAGKPVLTINEILSTINVIQGEQVNNRADITFRPFEDGDSVTATALAKAYLQISNNNRLHWKESEVFDDGIITSRGFFDVRMKFERQMRGEVDISVLNPKNVVIDPDADKYDPDTWSEVFITKWMTPDQIDATYGEGKSKALKQVEVSRFETAYDSIDNWEDSFAGDTTQRDGDKPKDKLRIRVIERQYRKSRMTEHFVDPRTGDSRPVPKSWSKTRIKRTQNTMDWRIRQSRSQQIRWRISADSVTLFDEWSPYQHFTVVPYFPYFRRGHTMGVVEHLISPQEMFNKVASQEVHVVNSSANGGWKLRKGSLQNMDIDELEKRGAETGLVLELENPDDAQKIQPNQIPSGLDRLTVNMREYIKAVSNVSDSMRGFDREDVAAKAIQAKRQAGAIGLSKPMDNLVRTRYLLARNILCLIQEFYTEERILRITEERPGAKMEEIPVNQVQEDGTVLNDLTLGTYDVVVGSTAVRDGYMDDQFEEAKALRELGLPIPDHVLIASSHLEKKNEIIEEMQQDPQAEANARREELELAEMEVALQDKQAEAQRKMAETSLAQARAEKTSVDAQKTAMDAQTAQSAGPEIALQYEKMMLEAQLEREKMAMEMQLKREEMAMDAKIKMAEAEERLAAQPAPWEVPVGGAGSTTPRNP